MGGVIAGDAQQRLLGLPGVEEANVEIVWETAMASFDDHAGREEDFGVRMRRL